MTDCSGKTNQGLDLHQIKGWPLYSFRTATPPCSCSSLTTSRTVPRFISHLSSFVSLPSPRWPTSLMAPRRPQTVVRRSTRALHRTHSDLGYSLSASFPVVTSRYLRASKCPTSSSAPLPTTISSSNSAPNSHRVSATLSHESASGGYLMSSSNSTKMRFSWMHSQARSTRLIGCTKPICTYH